jgi:hypothetical protein
MAVSCIMLPLGWPGRGNAESTPPAGNLTAIFQPFDATLRVFVYTAENCNQPHYHLVRVSLTSNILVTYLSSLGVLRMKGL